MASSGQTKLQAVNEMLSAVKQAPVTALDTNGTSDAALAEQILDRESLRVQSIGWKENTDRYVSLALPTDSIVIGTVTGTFVAGETVTQATSGATGRYHYTDSGSMYLTKINATAFTTPGPLVLTGATSAATTSGAARSAVTSGAIGLDADVLDIEGDGSDSYRDLVMRDGKIWDANKNTATLTAAVTTKLIRLLDFVKLPPKIKDVVVGQAKLIFQRRMVGDQVADGFMLQEFNYAGSVARGRPEPATEAPAKE